jgi:hypothetical protein
MRGVLPACLTTKSPGQPSKLNDVQRQAIVRMIESGPIPAIHGVVRWRLIDLSQWIYEEFRVTVAKQTLSRELRAMGYPSISIRASSEVTCSKLFTQTEIPSARLSSPFRTAESKRISSRR